MYFVWLLIPLLCQSPLRFNLVSSITHIFLFYRRGVKLGRRVSARIKITERASGNKQASEIPSDNLEVGIINRGISMENAYEAGYTHLQRDQVGYEALKPPVYLEVLDSCTPPPPECSIEQEDDCGYTIPQIQSSKDILDAVIEKTVEPGNTVYQTPSSIYEEIADSPIQKERESGYLQPLSQSDVDKSPDTAALSCLNSEAESYVEMH